MGSSTPGHKSIACEVMALQTWSQGMAQAEDKRLLKQGRVVFTGDSAFSLVWPDCFALATTGVW